MICHGRSSAKAIKNAIRRAKGLAESRVDELIQRDIEESFLPVASTEDSPK
jgi:glycerol-3-phosphate acyltransferase PlsX